MQTGVIANKINQLLAGFPSGLNLKKGLSKMKVTTQKEARLTKDREQPQEFVSPEVNIFETKDGYVLEAEMPGVRKDGLEIALEGNVLTITGRRHVETFEGSALFRESNHLNYRRVFELDPAIDSARIAAKMDQGLLTLTLPKSEKVKPRTIKVE
jgi:HSP20 family protein